MNRKNGANWNMRRIFPPFSSIFLLVHHIFYHRTPIISPSPPPHLPPFSTIFPHFPILLYFPEANRALGDTGFGCSGTSGLHVGTGQEESHHKVKLVFLVIWERPHEAVREQELCVKPFSAVVVFSHRMAGAIQSPHHSTQLVVKKTTHCTCPRCISYALVQAAVGVGTILIWYLILIGYQM